MGPIHQPPHCTKAVTASPLRLILQAGAAKTAHLSLRCPQSSFPRGPAVRIYRWASLCRFVSPQAMSRWCAKCLSRASWSPQGI